MDETTTKPQKKLTPLQRICKNCQNEFETYLGYKEFCSSDCKYEFYGVRRHKKPFENIPCKQCHKLFKPKSIKHKFCSRECSTIGNFVAPKFDRSKKRICNFCGSSFLPKTQNHIYCSHDCLKKAQKAVNPLKRTLETNGVSRHKNPSGNIPCKQCHKLFKPKSINHKYCSRECRAIGNFVGPKFDKSKKRICNFCGSSFLPKTQNHSYCSHECLKKAQNAVDPPKRTFEKNCVVCNKTFIPVEGYLIYCSETCFKNKYIRIKQSFAEKSCEICEKKFIPTSKSQVICSKSCQDDFLEKDKIRMRIEKVFCKFCGYYFDVSGKYKPFCSPECDEEYHGIKKLDKIPPPRYCLDCKKFQVINEVRKLCNDKNCDTYKSERKIKKIMNDPDAPVNIGSCLYCNETFRVFFPYQKFCSAECHMLFKVRCDQYAYIIPEEF